MSSLLYGVADFLGGEAAKRAPAAAVVLWSGVISFPLILVGALSLGGTASGSDYLFGALAGASGSLGLVFLFAGLGRGRAAAVAPVSAGLAAIFPVVIAVLNGERPSTLAWIGVAVAVPAIMLCAWVVDDPGETALGGFFYGVAAGLGFGGFTALIRYTDDASNLLPLIATRGATIVVVLAISLIGWWRVVGFGALPGRIVVGNAILDVSGNISILFALRAGSLALAAVSASFYPAVTVIMARLVNGEHLAKRQVLGVILTLGALVTIAFG